MRMGIHEARANGSSVRIHQLVSLEFSEYLKRRTNCDKLPVCYRHRAIRYDPEIKHFRPTLRLAARGGGYELAGVMNYELRFHVRNRRDDSTRISSALARIK